eukprot:TRINITY_DN123433_c0_g1_i1.p1 TRINITY_DN123433_c0_g1~~TRINITY_DN123433_c0_g1_i1.p1  ORF type:complete len:303 (-),score=77.73 TRINITY_DN123433_c0_g1_i1:132-1040(-)
MGHVGSIEGDYSVQEIHKGSRCAAGEGAFSQVRAATNLHSHELRCVKTIAKTDFSTRWRVFDEIRMLQAASEHKNVTKYFEYYEEFGSMHLVLEYCPHGNMEKALSSKAVVSSEKVAAMFMSQLLDVLKFLKEKRILHRDVKPANLVFADKGTVKLTDFGVAVELPDGTEPLRDVAGTGAFNPPEMFMLPRGKGYGFPADVWSAGVTAFMLMFQGAHPFEENGSNSIKLLKTGTFTVGWTTSSAAKDFLEAMMWPMEKQRLTAEDALRHPWMAACGHGPGDLKRERPRKYVPDSHGNWVAFE